MGRQEENNEVSHIPGVGHSGTDLKSEEWGGRGRKILSVELTLKCIEDLPLPDTPASSRATIITVARMVRIGKVLHRCKLNEWMNEWMNALGMVKSSKAAAGTEVGADLDWQRKRSSSLHPWEMTSFLREPTLSLRRESQRRGTVDRWWILL